MMPIGEMSRPLSVYVLTYEFCDRSSFNVCGVTTNYTVALAWFKASDDTNVYEFQLDEIPSWNNGQVGWRKRLIGEINK